MFDGPHDHGQRLIITQVVELRLFSACVLNAQLLNLFVCLLTVQRQTHKRLGWHLDFERQN